MGWFTKLLKGSNHKISRGQYHGKYGDDRIWDNHRSSADDLTDIEKEDIDRAIALSLSEEDQKGKKVVEDDSHSEEDEQLCKIDEEENEHLGKVQPEEDEHLGKVQLDEDEYLAKIQLDEDEHLAKVQLEEDEQLARAIQESLNIGSPPRYDNDSLFRPFPHVFPPGYRICAGCNTEIGHGRFLSCMGAIWHPECFRCHACNLPITDYEFSMSSNRPYHKSCYREQHHPRCDVCKNFIPTNSAGLIEYRAHPFWLQKYCPSHERDGTPRCCSCERMEPRDTKYLLLDDGRKLCLECLDSAIMDSHECQPLYLEIQEFYEGLNMKVEQQVPMLLVERQALNEAMEGEKNGHHHLPETRGLCLSEEQTVTTILTDTLSSLPSLLHLDLSFNNFSGLIPASFGNFRQLESLILVSNLLNGTIPSSLGNVSTLKKLHLAYNHFITGSIPSALGNLTNLEVLWLAGCSLVGSIPSSLGTLVRLQNLDLSQNMLTGTIPETLFVGLKSVVQIELYQNSLSGELPRGAGIANLTELERFDASTNELIGTIPDELCRLKKLGSLNLYDNKLEGSLPKSIAGCENLYELRLFNNTLSGTLPSDLGNNSRLQSLDVSYNNFSGEIPASLCRGGGLQELLMIYNSFSGKIPEKLGDCKSLTRVRLRNNNLSGTVPDALWGLPHLYLLDVAENSLSGSISNAISGAYNLSILLISSNKFSGSIPEAIGSLDNLVVFVACHNNLTGRIPTSMVKLSQLGRLVLSDNELSGEIPEGIGELKKLNELDLANNRFDGNIPSELGTLPVLNYLDLSGNYFSGEIPMELQNLMLNLLNLSNNQLSGDIPPLYANDNYIESFLGNPGLCGDLSGLCPKPSFGESKNHEYVWIFRFIFVLAGIVFVVGVAWFYFKFRNFKKMKKRSNMSKWRSFHKLGFSEFEIVKLLSEDNVIGSGASGKVYKVVLSNGEVVAVKKLWGANKMENGSAESEKDGFEAEVETMGKIRHKNIVRLWCCCNSGDSKLLVYEYMPNGSLAELLHSSKKSLLDWPTRYKIAIDAAEGLSYLHQDCVPPIVHRDVKSNNILLDGEFGAKVADFGLAKIVREVSQGAECMSVIAGSYGYIAPEYAYTLRVNEKSDIYSFGVVILELVTGKSPLDPEYGEKDLVKWVSYMLDQKGEDQVIDPTLDSKYREEISKVLSVGLLCTSSLPITRPSMRRVVKMLQEVTSVPKSRSGKPSPYYQEEVSDNDHQGSLV